MLISTIGMTAETAPRIERHVARGHQYFLVTWSEHGFEHSQSFPDEQAASAFVRQLNSAATGPSQALDENAADADAVTDVQLLEQSFRANKSFVVSWTQFGVQQREQFVDLAAAQAKIKQLSSTFRPQAVNGHNGPHVTNGHDVANGSNGNGVAPAVAYPPSVAFVPAPVVQVPPRRVLLICPDPPTRYQLLGYLIENHHLVETENDETQAIDALGRIHPDVVLLSLNNPTVPGLQVCRQIKRSPTGRDTSVILVCSSIDESDQAWGLKQGATAFLTNPFTPERINDVLR
jgi:twitching motility two-component system response regulator PilH